MKYSSILSLAPLLSGALCSVGDRLGEFVECNRVCRARRRCEEHGGAGAFADDSPFAAYTFADTPVAYRALLWDCSADCDYQCQQVITRRRLLEGEEPVQFHGKWPFVRMLGMQEFFASVFSVANFVPHLQGYRQLQRELKRVSGASSTPVLLRKYRYLAAVGMLAWVCSAVFHARDMPLTEKLDYFFAGATVLAGFHALYIRFRRLDLAPARRRLFSLSVLLVFGLHVARLYRSWSYTYNMRFNICFGLLQYLLLVLLALQNYSSLRRQRQQLGTGIYAQRPGLQFQLVLVPVLLVLYTAMAMSSELFDFFSYRWQIDSHAIWHFLTVAPSFVLYDFFLKDYRYLNTLYSPVAPE
ncbi:AaceriAFR678Cp [[Ashbya] aceris (nom. inval.)]|nr:AaceriAFR678Cp [[Ashbya] aceris (nom. inval.)]